MTLENEIWYSKGRALDVQGKNPEKVFHYYMNAIVAGPFNSKYHSAFLNFILDAAIDDFFEHLNFSIELVLDPDGDNERPLLEMYSSVLTNLLHRCMLKEARYIIGKLPPEAIRDHKILACLVAAYTELSLYNKEVKSKIHIMRRLPGVENIPPTDLDMFRYERRFR